MELGWGKQVVVTMPGGIAVEGKPWLITFDQLDRDTSLNNAMITGNVLKAGIVI